MPNDWRLKDTLSIVERKVAEIRDRVVTYEDRVFLGRLPLGTLGVAPLWPLLFGERKKMEITIAPVTNGHLVRAGCMTLVFEDKLRLLSELTRWFENPQAVEAEYQKRYYKGYAEMDAAATLEREVRAGRFSEGAIAGMGSAMGVASESPLPRNKV